MASDPTTLASLPNEILSTILSHLPTSLLLQLTTLSHRFHALIQGQLHARLARAATLPYHQTVLECYPPMDQYIAAPWDLEPHPLPPDETTPLRARYTRFRADERRCGGPAAAAAARLRLELELEADESFAQLCTSVHLLRVGGLPDQMLGGVTMVDKVIRVGREWLAQQAGRDNGGGEGAVLWADGREDVGVRFRVRRLEAAFAPVLLGPGEEFPVRYELRYKELVIRTTELLLWLEKSEAQAWPTGGKAVVLASV